ncbi:hypothetical protein C5C57_12075 [Rathayibacter sp. AY1C5]|nr:hypothetical protein C5C57_12075 [Rathayibacter sp. AY1C5]
MFDRESVAARNTAAREIEQRTRDKKFYEPGTYKRGRKEVDLEDRKANLKLKKILARSTFIAVGVQLWIADVVFVWYGVENHWRVPPGVMLGWLSATVVQTVGVVYIIARHLFPVPTPPEKKKSSGESASAE